MRSRRALIGLCVAALLAGGGLPAQAQPSPLDVFGVSVVEGPGTITNLDDTVYNHNDPLWSRCKAALQALGVPGLPADDNGGVFFPCFGPPITHATTHFRGSGIQSPDPVNAGSFCASTLGACVSESIGTITGAVAPNSNPAGLQSGAYCGSSKGTATGTFSAVGIPGVHGPVNYSYTVSWEQSAATILPLVGRINGNAGTTIVGFVSARTTNDSRGTCGRPSSSQDASGQVTFAVDGLAVSFDTSP